MPHSTQDSVDSSSSNHSDSRRPGPSNTMASTSTVSKGAGMAQTRRDSRTDLPSQSSNASKRTSSPIADAFADLVGRGGNIDEVLATRPAGDRTSMGQYIDSRRRTQFYEDQFRYKDNEAGSVKDRVQRDSPVIAELRTNVIIKDEFTLVTDLSYHLAQRYTRPDSSIMLKIDHSACLALGGTFDPCYILTVTALPSQMGPSTNKRNAALIQSFMADILSVPSDRGIIKFQAIEECNYATNGTTMLGEIERLEKHQTDDPAGNAVRRAITNASRKSVVSSNRKSMSHRTDTDVKTPNGAPASALSLNGGRTSTEQKRRSTQLSQPLTSAIPNVFELPASSEGGERPLTSNGSYAAENGLRMNGVSKEDLTRMSSGRPKTFAGSSARPPNSSTDSEPSLPTTTNSRPSVDRRVSSSQRYSIKPEPKAANIPTSPKPSLTPRPRSSGAPPSTASTPKPKSNNDTYLDNVTTANNTNRHDPKIDARAAEKNRQLENGKDTAANTAKRRSTVTATPKMPPPPPVPESKTAGREPKVGKRKSFLSAFRRSQVP